MADTQDPSIPDANTVLLNGVRFAGSAVQIRFPARAEAVRAPRPVAPITFEGDLIVWRGEQQIRRTRCQRCERVTPELFSPRLQWWKRLRHRCA